MSKDHQLHDELVQVCNRYAKLAQDPVWFCRQMQMRFSELEAAALKSRTPSGIFSAATVERILKGEEP